MTKILIKRINNNKNIRKMNLILAKLKNKAY